MKFLLDENIPGHTRMFLLSEGHEVLLAPPSAEDAEIMALGETKQAVVITRDRDFLNFLPSILSGIIYVPIHPSIAEHITEALGSLLKEIDDHRKLSGRVTILNREGYEILP